MSVIEDLFNGNILPSERIIATSRIYADAKERSMLLSQQLNDSLSSIQRKLYDDYCTESSIMMSEMYLAFFRYGLQLGAQLEREINQQSETSGL